MSSGFSELPVELIDAIVDNFPEDIELIKALSLVSRLSALATRPHVFRKITIAPPPRLWDTTSPEPGHSSHELRQLLNSSPYIIPLIQELVVVLVGAESFAIRVGVDSFDTKYHERHVPWILDPHYALADILSRLSLRSLSLVENTPCNWSDGGYWALDWNRLDDNLRSAFLELVTSPRLERIHLRGVVFASPAQLFDLVNRAPSLIALSLSRIRFVQRPPNYTPLRPARHPRLLQLSIADRAGDMLIKELAMGLNLSLQIAKFTAQLPTVTHLRFSTEYTENEKGRNWRSHDLAIDFKLLTSIETLRSIHISSSAVQTHPDWFLRAFSENTRLEQVTLEGAPGSRSFYFRDDLHQAASVPPTLRGIEILRFCIPGSGEFLEWEERVRSQWSDLTQNGQGLELIIREIPDPAPKDEFVKVGWE
ncbi:hypothetical protein C8F01DRAFT_1146016 [Mycena amicta]|nr:hypothetical protein C8F01DRAFT_1146016 [Mycena amicta]